MINVSLIGQIGMALLDLYMKAREMDKPITDDDLDAAFTGVAASGDRMNKIRDMIKDKLNAEGGGGE